MLEAIYELSGGNPGKMVDGSKAAEMSNIAHTIVDFKPVAMHQRDSGLVGEHGVGLYVFNITPAGIRAVNEGRPPAMMA